jgi:hypothetical protein
VIDGAAKAPKLTARYQLKGGRTSAMTFELVRPTTTTKRELSVQLADLFVQINTTFGHAKELILKAYNLAKQEGYSPAEAKHLIMDNITVFSEN